MSTKTQDTYTVEQLITAGQSIIISYNNFSFHENLSNGTQISIHNVINDYMDELLDSAVTVKFGTDEYRKYCYKPKLLCSDIYGNPEVYFVILLMNNIIDVKEFNKEKIKMLKKKDMSDFLNVVYNAERTQIYDYNNRA